VCDNPKRPHHGGHANELARLLRDAPPGLIATGFIEGNGRAVFENACKLGLERIVSKRRDAPYRSGRDPNWRKIKCQGYEPERRVQRDRPLTTR
jgi:hypothetical protein